MSSPKKRTNKTELVMRASYADSFIDQREKADIALDLKKADLAVENL